VGGRVRLRVRVHVRVRVRVCVCVCVCVCVRNIAHTLHVFGMEYAPQQSE
jgi:hypothetical protein